MNPFAGRPARRLAMALLVSILMPAQVQAQVIVHGTRQIFPGNQREITVRIENVGQRAALVQAWTDDGDKQAAPEQARTPFVLRPPVFRLDAGRSQALRVLLAGDGLPQDRESIYWLNVLDIPPAPREDEVATGNFLQFSLRTRIKLIYRPKGLEAAAAAPYRLKWTLVPDRQGWALQVDNPTPYYVHFIAVGLRAQGRDHPAADPQMVAPWSQRRYPLQGLSARPAGGTVRFEFVNDQGGSVAQSIALNVN